MGYPDFTLLSIFPSFQIECVWEEHWELRVGLCVKLRDNLQEFLLHVNTSPASNSKRFSLLQWAWDIRIFSALTGRLSLVLTCRLFQALSSTGGTNCLFLLNWSSCICNYATSVHALYAGEAGIFSKMKSFFRFKWANDEACFCMQTLSILELVQTQSPGWLLDSAKCARKAIH